MTEAGCRYGSVEPELEKCRTMSVGSTIPGTNVDMYYCLIDNADCKYARSFGYDYVCKHVDNYKFAVPLQTKREQVSTCSRCQIDGESGEPGGYRRMSVG